MQSLVFDTLSMGQPAVRFDVKNFDGVGADGFGYLSEVIDDKQTLLSAWSGPEADPVRVKICRYICGNELQGVSLMDVEGIDCAARILAVSPIVCGNVG